MAAPIGPGDFVECVIPCNENDSAVEAHWLCGAEIIKGRIYTIMRIERGIDNFGDETEGFVLVEKDTHFPRGGDGELGAWMVSHFAPDLPSQARDHRGAESPAEAGSGSHGRARMTPALAPSPRNGGNGQGFSLTARSVQILRGRPQQRRHSPEISFSEGCRQASPRRFQLPVCRRNPLRHHRLRWSNR